MNALQGMDRYLNEEIQVSTQKHDIKVQYLYDNIFLPFVAGFPIKSVMTTPAGSTVFILCKIHVNILTTKLNRLIEIRTCLSPILSSIKPLSAIQQMRTKQTEKK